MTYIDVNLWYRTNLILIPVMVSRLMISLKKVTAQAKMPWSLDTMTTISLGRSTGDGTVDSAPRVPGGLHETSQASAAPNGEDMELGAMP